MWWIGRSIILIILLLFLWLFDQILQASIDNRGFFQHESNVQELHYNGDVSPANIVNNIPIYPSGKEEKKIRPAITIIESRLLNSQQN